MGFFSTWLGLLVRPVETLTRLESQNREIQVELASGFLVSVMFLGSLMVGAYSLAVGTLTGNGFLAVLGIFAFAEMMVFGVVGALLGAVWYHLWLWLFGVRNWRRTLTAYCYAHAPAGLLLVSALPEGPFGKLLVYGIVVLWTLILFARAVRLYHGLPLKTSAAVLFIAFLVNFALVLVFPSASALFPQPFPAVPSASALPPVPPAGGLSPG